MAGDTLQGDNLNLVSSNVTNPVNSGADNFGFDISLKLNHLSIAYNNLRIKLNENIKHLHEEDIQRKKRKSKELNAFIGSLDQLIVSINKDITSQLDTKSYTPCDIMKTMAYSMIEPTQKFINEFSKAHNAKNRPDLLSALHRFKGTTDKLVGVQNTYITNAVKEVIKTAFDFILKCTSAVLKFRSPVAAAKACFKEHDQRSKEQGLRGQSHHFYGLFDTFTNKPKEIVKKGKRFIDFGSPKELDNVQNQDHARVGLGNTKK